MSTLRPVTAERIAVAKRHGLVNVETIAATCREAGVPFYAACALFMMESGGRNLYGHDVGGTLAGYPEPVTKENFAVFAWLVFTKGQPSNGVGPSQITYKGYFTDMQTTGLNPWSVHDNMLYGLRILAANYKATGSWEKAGARYNGGGSPSPAALDYGRKFLRKAQVLHDEFGLKGTLA